MGPPKLPLVPPYRTVESPSLRVETRSVSALPPPLVDGATLARVAALMARRADAILSGWLLARVASSGALARFLEADPWMPPAGAAPRAKRRKIPAWNAATLKGQRTALFVQAMQNPTAEQRANYRGTARPSLPALTRTSAPRNDPSMSNPISRSTLRWPAPRPNPRLANPSPKA